MRYYPMHFPLPGDLDAVERGFERWRKLASDSLSMNSPEVYALLRSLFGNSPYLSRLALHNPDVIRDLASQGVTLSWCDLMAEIAICESQCVGMNVKDLKYRLRRFKQHAALILAVAEIAQAWSGAEAMAAQSFFAERMVRVCLRYGLGKLVQKRALAVPDSEEPEKGSGFFILGVGKLGAWELNYSSDIDLIVLYDEMIEHPIPEYSSLFIRLTQDVIQLLEERTAEGYVFRVDLRLRPDPGATPVALSVAAAQTYYASFGQNWERAALIKARPIAGDMQAAREFMTFLKRFIWRKYLDFAAIQDIQSIKRQINTHKGHHTITVKGHDIKLGKGGIREIEFFTQTQQLIFGGRYPYTRCPSTLRALDALADNGQITDQIAENLKQAYSVLRRIENRLQMVEDQQTHRLPMEESSLRSLATFLDYPSQQAFETDAYQTLRLVQTHYAELFQEESSLGQKGNLVFTGLDDDSETIETLTNMGFQNPSGIVATVSGWHHGRYRATSSARSRQILTELIPPLLDALSKEQNPDQAFIHFDAFLKKLPAGEQFLSLFYQNPSLLSLFANIMGTDPHWIVTLSLNPSLFDILLQEDFSSFPSQETLRDSLKTYISDPQDIADLTLMLHQWHNEHIFRAGVHILRHGSQIDRCGRYLSDVADSEFDVLLPAIRQEFEKCHGTFPKAQLAILAMGKWGSQEMGIGSDLDLILIYDLESADIPSDGSKPLMPSTYFLRLTQRLYSVVTAKSSQGYLYEIDMRLRPSGYSGPLATSFQAFVTYQKSQAWTWEHMALTKARIVAADPDLKKRLRQAIIAILTQPRVKNALATDILQMRRRIDDEYKTANPWNLKYIHGGLIDLTFLAQYFILMYASDHPEILNQASYDLFDCLLRLGVLEPQTASDLGQTYRLWRMIEQYLRMIHKDKVLSLPFSADVLAKLSEIVVPDCPEPLDCDALEKILKEKQRQVSYSFQTYLTPDDAPSR